jgi:hypothetical protein
VVALVQAGGKVSFVAKAGELIGPTKVRLVDGIQRPSGYKLKLKSFRAAENRGPLGIHWRVIGQIRYFDNRTWTPVIVGELKAGDRNYLNDAVKVKPVLKIRSREFSGGIIGLPHNAPESKLVREYVSWLRAADEFRQAVLRPEKLVVDLFDRSRYRLIEAKMDWDRRTLRTAVGQLLDYKRFYPRKPSLGVLLSHKPSKSSLRFLAQYRVVAVWQTLSGRFSDSTGDGGWTLKRRRPRN